MIDALLAYGIALTLQVSTPGPAALMVSGMGAARGFAPALSLGLGVALGDVVVAAAVLTGIAAISAMYPPVVDLVRYAGAAYLAFLGIAAICGCSPQVRSTEGRFSGRIMVFGGVIALTNPKGILFHASIMPALLGSGSESMHLWLPALTLVLVVNVAVMSLYGALTSWMKGSMGGERRMMALNRFSGGCMIFCATFLLLR